MIITHDEVEALRTLLETTRKTTDDYLNGPHDEDEEDLHDWAHEIRTFVTNNPHLLMSAGGFDECRVLSPEEAVVWGWPVPTAWWDRVDGFDVPLRREQKKHYLFFKRPTGQWFYLARQEPDRFTFIDKSQMLIMFPGLNKKAIHLESNTLLAQLSAEADRPVSEERTLVWHPKAWSPYQMEKEHLLIIDASAALLRALRAGTMRLDQLSWKQLEDVVAGVLKQQGYEIHVVRESPQGGRDIFAQTVTPSGDRIVFAVEVKCRAVVGRPQIETALWQNRYFPGLIFVTSGRFTAGAIAEQRLPENRFRLVLKDGEALGDIIKSFR